MNISFITLNNSLVNYMKHRLVKTYLFKNILYFDTQSTYLYVDFVNKMIV